MRVRRATATRNAPANAGRVDRILLRRHTAARQIAGDDPKVRPYFQPEMTLQREEFVARRHIGRSKKRRCHSLASPREFACARVRGAKESRCNAGLLSTNRPIDPIRHPQFAAVGLPWSDAHVDTDPEHGWPSTAAYLSCERGLWRTSDPRRV